MVRQHAVPGWLAELQARNGRDGGSVQLPEGLPAEGAAAHVVLRHYQGSQLYAGQGDLRARRAVAAREMGGLDREGTPDVLILHVRNRHRRGLVRA